MSPRLGSVGDSSGSSRAADDATERAWVVAVRTGDAGAFEEMFTAYAARLAGFVWTYLSSEDECEEIVQDLFLWIWEHRFEWEVPGSLRTYLFRSAANRALSRLRHRRVERRFLERSPPEQPLIGSASSSRADHETAERELSSAIDETVAKLPERCRTVFILNRQQHLSYAEIAELLGISPRTVEVHMGRALAELRKQLTDWTSG